MATVHFCDICGNEFTTSYIGKLSIQKRYHVKFPHISSVSKVFDSWMPPTRIEICVDCAETLNDLILNGKKVS